MCSSDLKNEAKSCTSAKLVAKWIDDSRREKLSDATFKRYVECVRSAVNRLDDGVSSAEVIARGLHSACIGLFNESLELSPTLNGAGGDTRYRMIEPQLVQAVLERRASLRKPANAK